MSWQAKGAQTFKGVWSIRVKTEEARTTLLKRHIMIDSRDVKLYAHNPYTRRRHDDESEKIVIKDFSMWQGRNPWGGGDGGDVSPHVLTWGGG